MADLTFTPRRAAMALASEGLAGLDVAGLLTDPVFWGAGVPRGQGEPVLLIPGYMVGDRSLALMAGWLQRIGYATRRSGIRRNVDRTDATVALLSESLQQQAAGDPRRVAIVGQSLGGFIA